MTLLPAYGRDYKSKKEVLADWDANKDFLIAATGQYVNKPQLKKGDQITFRYNKKRSVFLHVV